MKTLESVPAKFVTKLLLICVIQVILVDCFNGGWECVLYSVLYSTLEETQLGTHPLYSHVLGSNYVMFVQSDQTLFYPCFHHLNRALVISCFLWLQQNTSQSYSGKKAN